MALGTIAIEPVASPNKHGLLASRYAWRPGPKVQENLPSGFELTMIGYRRIPEGPLWFVKENKHFFNLACAGGLAIFSHKYKLDKESRFSYRMMSLMFQQSVIVKERLKRQFKSFMDLVVVNLADSDDQSPTILPDTLGQSSGRHWDIKQLLRAGKLLSANRSGTTTDFIRLGLVADARADPIDPATLSEEEVFTIVKMGLFELTTLPTVIYDQQVLVMEHFLEAVENHNHLEYDAFNSWFFDNYSNIVHSVSKKAAIRKILNRSQVRSALLAQLVEANRYVATCIHLMMQEFMQALPEPLTSTEQTLFCSIYSKQRHFGGLPLVMLEPRYEFAKEAFADLLADPANPKRIGTLLRLLDHYAQMCNKRRAVDRLRKAKPSPPKPRGTPKRRTPSEKKSTELRATNLPWNLDIIDLLRQRHRITCDCRGELEWHPQLKLDSAHNKLLIDDGCSACGTHREWDVTIQEYRNADAEWDEM